MYIFAFLPPDKQGNPLHIHAYTQIVCFLLRCTLCPRQIFTKSTKHNKSHSEYKKPKKEEFGKTKKFLTRILRILHGVLSAVVYTCDTIFS